MESHGNKLDKCIMANAAIGPTTQFNEVDRYARLPDLSAYVIKFFSKHLTDVALLLYLYVSLSTHSN